MAKNDPASLRRHHQATIGLFVAFWILTPIALIAIELFDVSGSTRDALVGAVFGGAVVCVLLQFSQRCPICRANLGWQARLGIPERCKKCGTKLRS